MARGGDKSREAAGGKRRRQQQWEVEFVRYFATPRRGPSTPPPPPGLRYVSRGRNRLHGTWLPAASRAALRISRPTHSFAAHVLTVSIGNVVYAYILDTCHDVARKKSIADKGKGAAKEIDASIETFDMAGIETYVASDSFNDMLASLDKAIDELGGDMLL